MGVASSSSKDDNSKKINQDIDLQLFRSWQAKRNTYPHLYFNFRMILIGSDNPNISHKCSFFIKCNAITLIRILAFEQVQSLVSISKLLKNHLIKSGSIAESQKYHIKCTHSTQIISNLDFWKYKLDATLGKLITTIWNDNGIQHTFDWYQNELKKLRSNINNSNIIENENLALILDIIREHRIYPTFCQRFLNNLKDFTVRSSFDVANQVRIRMRDSLDYFCIDDYRMETKLTNYDYLVLEHALIEYYNENNYNCNVGNNFGHLCSLLKYRCFKEIPECSVNMIYQNVPINRRKEYDNINFEYIKAVVGCDRYSYAFWNIYASDMTTLKMFAMQERDIRYSASNRVLFINIDFVQNFFKIVSKLEQEQQEKEKENKKYISRQNTYVVCSIVVCTVYS